MIFVSHTYKIQIYSRKSEKFSGYYIDSQCEFEKEKFRDTFMVNSERQIEQSSE